MKNILNRKIRIAIIGCGRISFTHFEAIKKHKDDIELVSVCDNNEDILLSHKKKYKVNGYLNLIEMLDNEKLDLVSICTPHGIHANQTELCAKYGVNIITEKPMATTWNDATNMVKRCEESGVKLFVVKQNRRNSTLQLLKRALGENRFGKVHLVHLNVFWTRPQSYYDQAEWRGTWKFDGGAFMNQASHYVDLLTWLIGPVDKVQAMMSTSRNIEVEDTGVLNVKWRSGTLGSMSVTMLTYPKNLEGSITILGEKGSVRVGGVSLNKIEHWEFDEALDYDVNIKESDYQVSSVYGFGHLSYYNNVIEVLRGNAAPETDGREGLKSLEVIIAAYLSERSGKTISIPLEY